LVGTDPSANRPQGKNDRFDNKDLKKTLVNSGRKRDICSGHWLPSNRTRVKRRKGSIIPQRGTKTRIESLREGRGEKGAGEENSRKFEDWRKETWGKDGGSICRQGGTQNIIKAEEKRRIKEGKKCRTAIAQGDKRSNSNTNSGLKAEITQI